MPVVARNDTLGIVIPDSIRDPCLLQHGLRVVARNDTLGIVIPDSTPNDAYFS